LKPALEYLPRVLSRKTVAKFNNSRNFEVCDLCCKEIPDLLRGQRCAVVRLHNSDKGLPEFGIGYTKNCAIGDRRHADQRMLDFGRVDVHPARKHQISSPIADVKIPLVIKMTDVSNSNVSLVFDCVAITFAVDIGKEGRREAPSIDFSSHSRRDFIAVVIQNSDRYALHGPTGRAGLEASFG
jgi:hypothetical protein